MAIVTDPDDKKLAYKTIGKAINFSDKTYDIIVRKLPKPVYIPDTFRQNLETEYIWLIEEWQALTDEQREEWETEAIETGADGIDLWTREWYKGAVDNIYDQGYYDTAYYSS